MPPRRTGSIEPLKRADGSVYFRARIRVADDTRERVDVPEQYSKAAGGRTAKERAELYALAVQEREDEGGDQGPLLVAKRARLAEAAKKQGTGQGETCEKYFARFLEHRKAIGRVRRARDNESSWSVDLGEAGREARRRAREDLAASKCTLLFIIDTTLGYVKMAEDLTDSIGEPFPHLPPALVPSPQGGPATGGRSSPAPQRNLCPSRGTVRAKDWAKSQGRGENLDKWVGEAGFEPSRTGTL